MLPLHFRAPNSGYPYFVYGTLDFDEPSHTFHLELHADEPRPDTYAIVYSEEAIWGITTDYDIRVWDAMWPLLFTTHRAQFTI